VNAKWFYLLPYSIALFRIHLLHIDQEFTAVKEREKNRTSNSSKGQFEEIGMFFELT